MKQQEFILKLKTHLAGLPHDEVADIVRDQEEFIRDAISAGRSEESVVASLGAPDELAKSLKALSKIEKAQDQSAISKQLKGAFGVVAALLLLAPFNLIFVLGPFCAVLGMIFAGWAVSAVLMLLSIAAILLFVWQFALVSAVVTAKLATLFMFLGIFGLALLIVLAMKFFTKFMINATFSYFKWNLNFIKKQAVTI